jgi:hypothetical protein
MKVAMANAEDNDEPITITISDEQAGHAIPAPEILRLGGRPQWIQRDETPRCPACGSTVRFLAQVLAELKPFSVTRLDENVLLPFGAGGIAYIFICERECSPDSDYFMWQTT